MKSGMPCARTRADTDCLAILCCLHAHIQEARTQAQQQVNALEHRLRAEMSASEKRVRDAERAAADAAARAEERTRQVCPDSNARPLLCACAAASTLVLMLSPAQAERAREQLSQMQVRSGRLPAAVIAR